MNLNEDQIARIFAINCVHGQNLATDYQKCIKKAEELLKTQSWSEVVESIKNFVKSKKNAI